MACLVNYKESAYSLNKHFKQRDIHVHYASGSYLSTTIPARMAFATLRNLMIRSSGFLAMLLMDRVKVEVSHSLMTPETESVSTTSLSSCSSSNNRLNEESKTKRQV